MPHSKIFQDVLVKYGNILHLFVICIAVVKTRVVEIIFCKIH